MTKSNAKSITKLSEKNRDQNYKSSVFTQSATQHLQAIDARSKSIFKIKIDYKKLMVRQLINKINDRTQSFCRIWRSIVICTFK